MIDLDALDPNWQLAKKHGIASLPGIPLQKDQNQSQFCPCCMNQISKQQVPLCNNSKSLEFLGYGFPIYFIFIKFALILVLMLIITYSVSSIYWAYNNNWAFCKHHQPRFLASGTEVHCTGWMILLSRVELVVTNDQKLIRLTSFIVQLLILVYVRDILRKTSQYYDQKQISPSDFSILVQNLPKTAGIGNKLRQFLKNTKVFKKQYQIECIVYMSNLDHYFGLKSRKTQYVQELKKFMSLQSKSEDKDLYSQQIKSLEQKILNSKIAINQEELKQAQLISKDQALCEKLIIVINTEEEKEEIMQKFNNADKKIKNQMFGELGYEIVLKEAPQPKQILWENINCPKSILIKRTFISFTIYCLILGIVTLVFFYLLSIKSQQIQSSNQSSGSSYKTEALVYLSLFGVVFFNKFILSLISFKLTSYQKQKTGGQFQFSFALKQIFGLFFTTALMTLLVEDIKFHNIYTHKYGVIEEETIMFFMNGFVAPCIWLINPWHLYRFIMRYYYEGNRLITQNEANKIMELTHYSIGKRYSQIIEGLWFTFLYVSIIPLGSCLTLIGLAMFYWIDKYNLLRKSSVLENVSADICLQALTFLDFTLVLRPLGQILFDAQIRDSYSAISIVCAIIGLIYVILPINQILDFFHSQKFDLADKSYNQSKDMFLFDYQTLHPLSFHIQKAKAGVAADFAPNQMDEQSSHFNDNQRRISQIKNKCLKYSNFMTKRRHQSIVSSLIQSQISEGNSTANCMVKNVKNLPPLREIKKWNMNSLV